MSEGASPAELRESFSTQARVCEEMGSPLYGALLRRAADDVATGGPLARIVRGFGEHIVLHNLPLRLMGAFHYLALTGAAPALAAFLPSTGGRFEEEGAWRALLEVAREQRAELDELLGDIIQTNEVRRCCVLLPGFLTIAQQHELPLDLLEIGASAGLLQHFDRYHYDAGAFRWGDPAAALQLDCEWRGPKPPIDAPLRVASRSGCDPSPIDVSDPVQGQRLLSFFWPDQAERIVRLRAALETARQDAPRLVAASAGDWLPEVLAEPRPGRVTTVFHSVMWWYVPEDERASIDATIRAAGERATRDAPLAWLRFEGASTEHCDLRLLSWPSGEDQHLARAHYHGAWVEWLEG